MKNSPTTLLYGARLLIAITLALGCAVACDRLNAHVDDSEIVADRSCTSATPLTESLDSIWEETKQCTGLSAPPPRVLVSPVSICPGSDLPDCLADVPISRARITRSSTAARSVASYPHAARSNYPKDRRSPPLTR